MSEVEPAVLVYLGTVTALGLLIILRGLWWLRSTTRRRLRHTTRSLRFGAVRTSIPMDDPAELEERAAEAIQGQFTVTRRLFVPSVVLATAILAALPFVSSVPAGLLSGALAVLTIIVGIAVRPLVENAVAGLVISSSRLISIGDTVLFGDNYGVVEDITITHTSIKLWDWRRYVIPNQQMLQTAFINYTIIDQLVWAHVEFFVSPEADLEQVRDIAVDCARQSPANSQAERPRFWVMGMEKDAVRCWVAGWTNNP